MTLALSAYAQGLFPMDDPDAQGEPLPFYRADPRATFDLDDLDRTRHAARRSLAADPGWRPAIDQAFEAVVAGCARARGDGGVWLTPRLTGQGLRALAVDHEGRRPPSSPPPAATCWRARSSPTSFSP